MIKPLALYIGLRYTRAKRRNHFISFIALASMLGIALGVMVLITVLSVMNGFDYQIRNRFFAIAPQVTVYTSEDMKGLWQPISQQIIKIPGIEGAAPFVSGKAMLINQGQLNGVDLVGIDPVQEQKISGISKSIHQGSLASLQPGQFHIVMGQSMATNLGLKLGDTVNVFTPQVNVTLAGVFPRFRSFVVTGIFQASSAFGFEDQFAFIHQEDAEKLFPLNFGTRGFHVKIQDLYQANVISEKLQQLLPSGFFVTNWAQQSGAFFAALTMEKTMLFFILLLIVAVAVFNLVSTLVMAVNDKRADIAILKTLGMSPKTIMAIFMIQGGIIGLIGTLLGLVTGIILSLNVTALTNWIQKLFGIQFLSSSVFFIDYLPSQIQFLDIVKVCLAALILSFIATIYPAWLAFRTQPAEALRYE